MTRFPEIRSRVTVTRLRLETGHCDAIPGNTLARHCDARHSDSVPGSSRSNWISDPPRGGLLILLFSELPRTLGTTRHCDIAKNVCPARHCDIGILMC